MSWSSEVGVLSDALVLSILVYMYNSRPTECFTVGLFAQIHAGVSWFFLHFLLFKYSKLSDLLINKHLGVCLFFL